MPFIVTDLGFSTADAESVQIRHEGGNLILSFVDWQQRPVQYVFEDVIAYHWGHDSGEVPQDDQAYIILDSDWLTHEVTHCGVSPCDYIHFRLCFNALGILDALARKAEFHEILSNARS